jgi:hypothetical protein
MRVFQLLELPELLEADALYFILNGDYAESYLTDDNGVAKFIGNTSMIESLAAGGSTTVAELTDATSYDFPTLNTPVANALAAKANSTDLGTIATFEGDQNLRTTDSPTFVNPTVSILLPTGSKYIGTSTTRWARVWADSFRSNGATMSFYTGAGGAFFDNNLTASGTVTATGGTYTGTVNFGQIGHSAGSLPVSVYGSTVRFGFGANFANYFQVRSDGALAFGSSTLIGSTTATSLSQSAAGVLQIGSGPALGASGSLSLTNLTASGTVTAAALNLPGSAQLAGASGDVTLTVPATKSFSFFVGGQALGVIFSPAGSGVNVNARSFSTQGGLSITGANITGVSNLTASGTVKTGSKTVAAANALSGVEAGSLLWITNEAGGPCTAEYNGTAWVRVRDQIAISE